MGGNDLRDKVESRKRKRQKSLEIAFALLSTQPEGLAVSYIATTIQKSCRFRCGVNTMSQFMKPHIESGDVEKHRSNTGHIFWKLADVYIPEVETN